MRHRAIIFGLWIGCLGALLGQIYSPKVLLKDQLDFSDVDALAKGIVANAHAVTPRQKAEAIWRFFLTDGRYVQPGFWYHLSGWSYEEPKGEVLDPLKLLNSYGFGICYQIAPILQAVYQAAGFEDARVWFLTGHTVTEVFYEGGYHYFDSDLMGYNTIGKGSPKKLPVASVQEIAADGRIILDKLEDNYRAKDGAVDFPWYPADLEAGTVPALAGIFTSVSDNWLFPFTRYERGHSMDFRLRPGERMIRYFGAEEGLFYLPYSLEEKGWQETPSEIPKYNILTKNGPRSLRDVRDWATGRLEYRPVLWDRPAYDDAVNLLLPDAKQAGARVTLQKGAASGAATFAVQSPYVLIDAQFSVDASLREGAELAWETSVDNGATWDPAAVLKGPHQGVWKAAPKELAKSEHGAFNAIAGKYSYLARLKVTADSAEAAGIRDLLLTSRFEMNRRTLPFLHKGRNELMYQPGPQQWRRSIPVRLDRAEKTAYRFTGARYAAEMQQGMIVPEERKTAEVIFELAPPDGSPLLGVDVGGRFVDLRDGLAPEKRTAETRKTSYALRPDVPAAASLEWAVSPDGPYTKLWSYDPNVQWRDGKPVAQLLRWPEVDRTVRDLPPGTRKVYVRYRLEGVALDDARLAVIAAPAAKSSPLEAIHVWFDGAAERSHVERIANPAEPHPYTVTMSGSKPQNYALILSCPPPAP